MTSLYGRLFTYRAREKRNPLEDFLSEALADLLNRLPSDLAKVVFTRLIGQSDLPAAIERIWTLRTLVEWKTQQTILDRKVVDLVLYLSGNPVLVIENKVAAGFQQHAHSLVQGAPAIPVHQLATYCRWIGNHAFDGWAGAVVLLTHSTPAPDGFVENRTLFECEHRCVMRWSDLSRLFARFLDDQEDDQAPWRTFAHEFVSFLKEQNMAEELMTANDLSALNVFLPKTDRIEATVNYVWLGLQPLWRPFCQQIDQTIVYSTDYGCVWAFRYLKHTGLTRYGSFSFGIRFPQITQVRKSSAGSGFPYIFIELEDANALAISQPGDNWIFDEEDKVWTATRPVHTLPIDADLWAAEALTWAEARTKELIDALSKLS